MSKSTFAEKRKTGRASRSLGQSWQVPVFLLGVLIFAIVAASAPLRQDSEAYDFSCDLHHLREALLEEDAELDPLHHLADSLLLRQARYPAYAGEVEYLVGSLYQRQAQQTPEKAAELYARAMKHLQRSLSAGAPAGDEPVLLFQLGQCYHATGDLPRAIEHVERALTSGYQRRGAAYGLLVQAYLHLPEPNLEAALATNQKQLLEFTDEASLTTARLARGQILIKKGDTEEAYKTLERIHAPAPRGLIAEARYLQTQCCELEGRWDKAIPLWQELLEDPGKVPGGRARVLYALGVAYRQSGPGGDKQAESAWNEALKLGGEIGQAAALRLGELHMAAVNADAALKVWSQAVLGVKTPADYQNKLVELAEARRIFESGFHLLAQQGDFPKGQELALLYQRLAVPGEAEEKLADATAALARTVMEKAVGQTPDADAQRLQARKYFETAAKAYEQAVNALPAERQAKVLWRCAQCYVNAGDPARAVPALTRFVAAPSSDHEVTAQAWLMLGQSYEALNERDMARKAYLMCIELPASASAYEARYQIAEEQLQQGKLNEAIDNLRQCLSLLPPSRDNAMHEKSLYKLAQALYQRKDYSEARLKLKEAWDRFPGNPAVLTVRDQLGECYRKLGEQARENAKGSSSKETEHTYQAEAREWFGKALQIYVALVNDLEHRVLTDAEEEKLLRKAAFMVADLHFEVGSYHEALRRYQELQTRHRRQFAGLVACLRIWNCAGVMLSANPEQGPMAEKAVREALQIARQDLEQMQADHEAFHDRPGNWGRQHWLDWVNRRLEQLGPAPSAPAANAPPPVAPAASTPPPLPN